MSVSGTAELVLALLEGAEFANAMRRNGRPCRINLPGKPQARRQHQPPQEVPEVVCGANGCRRTWLSTKS